MKKSNIFLFTLSCIFLIGILCTIIGISLGGRLFSFKLDTEDSTGTQYTSGPIALSEEETADIRGIDFDVNANTMHVVLGDSYKIETNASHYTSSVKDGIWHVETKLEVATITFLSHSVRIPAFWRNWWHHDTHSDDSEFLYTITIPSDAKLETAKLSVAAGELTVFDKISADYVTLSIGAGDASVQEIDAKELNFKVNAGDGTIKKLQISDKCHAEVNAGKLTLGDDEDFTASQILINNLTGKTAAGDMTICGRLTGNCDLTCSTGDVDVLLDGIPQNYNFNTNSNLGDIDIENDVHDNRNHSDHSSETEIYGDIKLKCNMGDLSVEFAP